MIHSASMKDIRLAVQRTGISQEEAYPIIQSNAFKIFGKFPTLSNIMSAEEFASDCLWNCIMPRPNGLTFLEQFNPSIQKNKAAYIYRSMCNKALDILRHNVSTNRIFLSESQLNRNNEDGDQVSYYDILPSSDDPTASTITKEALNVLSKDSSHEPIFIEHVGKIRYSQYWVMYLFVIGYDIASIAESFKVSSTAVSNTLSNARTKLQSVYTK